MSLATARTARPAGELACNLVATGVGCRRNISRIPAVMSLLVLDPGVATETNGSVGHQLERQLTELGYTTLTCTTPAAALDLARQGNIALTICTDVEQLAALADLRAGVGLVLACGNTSNTSNAEAMDRGALLTAMRAGAHDCWQLPVSSARLSAQVEAVLGRVQRWVDELNAEVSTMRAELERDQRAGQYIQMGMLPPNPMGVGHYRLRHRIVPSLILSGDFVDYFQITDRHFACYVADVAGHGASSAFVTVLLKNFSRRLRREYRASMLNAPGEILSWFNAELIDQGIDKHVAMFLAVVDCERDVLAYANAAHFPPAVLVKPDGVQSLEQKGKPLGLFPELAFDSLSADFPPGSRLVAFSDGVLDLIDADSIAEKEAVLDEAIETHSDMDALWSVLDERRIGADDVSCLLVEHEA